MALDEMPEPRAQDHADEGEDRHEAAGQHPLVMVCLEEHRQHGGQLELVVGGEHAEGHAEGNAASTRASRALGGKGHGKASALGEVTGGVAGTWPVWLFLAADIFISPTGSPAMQLGTLTGSLQTSRFRSSNWPDGNIFETARMTETGRCDRPTPRSDRTTAGGG